MSFVANSNGLGSQGKVLPVLDSSKNVASHGPVHEEVQSSESISEKIIASIAKANRPGPEKVFHKGTVVLFTSNNPQRIVDEKIVSLFCIICGRKVPRGINDIACGSICRELIDGLVNLPAQFPKDLTSALSPCVEMVNPNETQTQSLPGRNDYKIFYPLYTKNNEKRKVREMLVRKYCVVCAEEIQRDSGAFDSIQEMGLRYRVSLGSEKNVFCSQSCIYKIRAILDDRIVRLPPETLNELWLDAEKS